VKELKVLRDDNSGIYITWEKNPISTKYNILGKTTTFEDQIIGSTTENFLFIKNETLKNYIGVSIEYIIENNFTGEHIVVDRTNPYIRKDKPTYEEITPIAIESYNGITISYASSTILDRYYIFEKTKNGYKKILETEDFQITSKLLKIGNFYRIEGYKKEDNEYQLKVISKEFKLTLQENKPINSKKISIIIPIYNCELLISRAIDSILLSSLKEIELILINDGSKDKTQEIIEWYQKRYPTIIKIDKIENQGTPNARNHGLSFATAPYTYFMDHDDYIHPKMLELMLKCAEETNADFVMNKIITRNDFDKSDIFFYHIDDKNNQKRYITKSYEEFILDKHNGKGSFYLVTLWQHIAKTELYKKHPMPRFKKYEDIAYVRDLFSYGKRFAFQMDSYYVWDKRIKNICETSTDITDKEMTSDEKNLMLIKAIFYFTHNRFNPYFDLMMYDALHDIYDACQGTINAVFRKKANYNRDNLYIEEAYHYIIEYDVYNNPYVQKDKKIFTMVKAIIIIIEKSLIENQ